MTAVCLACGARTGSALAPCRACGRRPETPADQARAMVASSDCFDEAGLEVLAREVRAGRPPALPEDRVRELTADLEATPAAPAWFALGVACGPIALVLGGLALAAGALGLLAGGASP